MIQKGHLGRMTSIIPEINPKLTFRALGDLLQVLHSTFILASCLLQTNLNKKSSVDVKKNINKFSSRKITES